MAADDFAMSAGNPLLEEEVLIKTRILDDSAHIAGTRVAGAEAPSAGSVLDEKELTNGKIPDSNQSQQYNVDGDDCLKISNLYLFGLCCSPILLLIDVGTDTWLAYQYYVHGDFTYFFLTITFVALPAIISTTFSIRM